MDDTSRRRPTIKDVAAAAGVGVMTVSYAFNRPERVAAATRLRVAEAAERLGYLRPDRTARALRSGRTGQLGVVFGEHLSYAFDDPQARVFLAGVAEVCVEHELGMVMIPTRGDDTDGDRILGAGVDGYVLWTTTDDDPALDAVARSGRPATIQGGPATADLTRVGPDDRAAARSVATAALTRGDFPVILSFPLDRDRAAILTDTARLTEPIRFPVTRDRLAGYRDGLAAAGYDRGSVPVAVVARNHRALGAAAMAALVPTIPQSAALVVLAMSDELALGARDAVDAAGRAAAIAGWDASPAARAAGVISVTNDLRRQGRLCAELALDPSRPAPDIDWEITDPHR